MTSRPILASFIALPFLLLTANEVHAQAIACADLTAIVENADADFAQIRGPLQSSIMPGASPLPHAPSTTFEVHLHATTRPLGGSESCKIRLMHKEDTRAALREATYHCDWPADPGFAALRQSVKSCLTNAEMREETADSLRLYIEGDASGDGEPSVHVSVETGGAKAAKLSITRTVCISRVAGGCGQR